MVTLTVQLTDAEYAALAHIALDPQDWFEDMVKLRCANTIAEIADTKIKEMIEDPTVESIPADKNKLFESLLAEGKIKSVAQMNDEEIEKMKTLLSTANDLTPETPSLGDVAERDYASTLDSTLKEIYAEQQGMFSVE